MGWTPFPVEIEADLSVGIPSFEVVGLPDASVRESRDRIRSSFKNSDYEFPLARITVNMAPADKKKEGSLYDLPLCVALLTASGQLREPDPGFLFLGELSLSGDVRPVRGVLPMVLKAREDGFRAAFVPADNAREGAVVSGIDVFPVHSVRELTGHLTGAKPLSPARPNFSDDPPAVPLPDFSDVRGQEGSKTRAGDRRGGRPQRDADRQPPAPGRACLPSACPPSCRT